MVTAAQIKRLCPTAKAALVSAVVDGWPLAEAAGITTNPRIRQFLANVAVETGGLTSIAESLTYTSAQRIYDVFKGPKSNPRFKSVAECQPYVRQPKKLAILVYGGRMGNKPAPSTDGWDFRGGGMLQTTGREGYRGVGYEDFPDALRTDPARAFRTAVQEWSKRGCNKLADKGDTTAVRAAINGGTNGLADVRAYVKKAEAIWPGDRGSTKPEASPVVPVAEDTIMSVQLRLRELGYTEVGRADGKMGTMTRTAILAFRLDNGLPLEPVIDAAFVDALRAAKPRVVQEDRQDASPSDVRKEVPEVRTNWLAKIGAFFTGLFSLIAAAFDGILSQLGQASSYIQPVRDALLDVPGWVWLLVIAAIALGLYLVARHGEAKGVEAFQSGARR